MVLKIHWVNILLFFFGLVWTIGLLTADAQRLDDREIEQRVEKLLGQMTLEEKVGQLVHFAADESNTLFTSHFCSR